MDIRLLIGFNLVFLCVCVVKSEPKDYAINYRGGFSQLSYDKSGSTINKTGSNEESSIFNVSQHHIDIISEDKYNLKELLSGFVNTIQKVFGPNSKVNAENLYNASHEIENKTQILVNAFALHDAMEKVNSTVARKIEDVEEEGNDTNISTGKVPATIEDDIISLEDGPAVAPIEPAIKDRHAKSIYSKSFFNDLLLESVPKNITKLNLENEELANTSFTPVDYTHINDVKNTSETKRKTKDLLFLNSTFDNQNIEEVQLNNEKKMLKKFNIMKIDFISDYTKNNTMSTTPENHIGITEDLSLETIFNGTNFMSLSSSKDVYSFKNDSTENQEDFSSMYSETKSTLNSSQLNPIDEPIQEISIVYESDATAKSESESKTTSNQINPLSSVGIKMIVSLTTESTNEAEPNTSTSSNTSTVSETSYTTTKSKDLTSEPTASLTTTQSTTSQPTTTQSTTSQPTTTQPMTSQPTTTQPTTTQPTTTHHTTTQLTTSKPTKITSQRTTTQPTSSQPTTSYPSTTQRTTAKIMTSKPTTTTATPSTIVPSILPLKTSAAMNLELSSSTTELITEIATTPTVNTELLSGTANLATEIATTTTASTTEITSHKIPSEANSNPECKKEIIQQRPIINDMKWINVDQILILLPVVTHIHQNLTAIQNVTEKASNITKLNLENNPMNNHLKTHKEMKYEFDKKEILKRDKDNELYDDTIDIDDILNDNGSGDYLGIDYVDYYKDVVLDDVVVTTTESNEADMELVKNEVEHNLLQYALQSSDGATNNHFARSVSECHGNATTVAEAVFPWIVTIFHKNGNTDQFEYVCDGVLLNNKAVLTSARCVSSAGRVVDASQLIVILGKRNLKIMQAEELVVRVPKLVVHPDFRQPSSAGFVAADLAILMLDSIVPMGSSIRAACLDCQGCGPVEQSATTGWALTGDLTPIFFKKENKDSEMKDKKIEGTYGLDVTVCPSHGGLYLSKRAGAWYVRGVSAGDPADQGLCFDRTLPYTSLTSYADWIHRVVGSL